MASLRSRSPTSTRSAATCSSRTMSRSCRASAPKRMETGTPVFLAARAEPRNRLSSVGVMPARSAVVVTMPAAARRSTRGTTMPSVTSLPKRSRELFGRPRGGRVGLRRQEVSAEFFLRAQARGGDDVDAGGAGQCLVELEVAAVEHAGAVDDRLAAVLAEVRQLRGQGLEDLCPVHGDVRGVLGAREHRQQGLMDCDYAQFRSGDGPQDRVDGLPGRGMKRVHRYRRVWCDSLASPLKIGCWMQGRRGV